MNLFTGIRFLPLVLLSQAAWPQTNVLTHHNDIARTGQNLNETILTPQSVNNLTFGKLFSAPVDGLVYAQPLYVSNLTLPSLGTHNVVFIATEHDSVYAFDADAGILLYQVSLIDPAHGASPGATSESQTCDEIVPEIGITGTPVIDPVSKTMYVAAKSTENALPVYRLHAIDITTGGERPNSPVVVRATVSSKTGPLSMDVTWQKQRAGLLLLNGIVYLAFGGICDGGPWHGWLLAYNAVSLQQTSAYATTPDGWGSGIWMSGAGLAADVPDPVNHPYGRLFLATGNGSFDGITDYGDDDERFDLGNGAITYADSFTPSIQASLASSDGDLGSGGVLLLPDQPGPHPRLLAQAGKNGVLYLVDRDNMGGYNSVDQAVQEIGGLGQMFGIPAYWNGSVYYWGRADRLKQFAVSGGLLTGPVAFGSETFGNGMVFEPGGSIPSISANGNTNGIVWNIDWLADVLYAHDAGNVATTLYSGKLGLSTKFSVPTVANGKVYVGSYGLLTAFGILPKDFSVSAAPATLTIAQGASAVSAISVAPQNGFTGIVTLSTGALAPGVSAALSPASILTSGSATLTVSATTAASGTFPITVTGSGTTGTHSAAVMVTIAAAAPTFTPAAGTYTGPQTVMIADATPGAAIHYTLDGSIPVLSSPVYTAPLQIGVTTTVKSVAFAAGVSPSAVSSVTYVIGQSSRAATGVWPMDAILSNTTPDLSGNGNTAMLTAAQLVPGRSGNAIQFNPSTGGGLTQRAPFDPGQSFSIAAWVKPAQTSTDQTFISQPAGQVSNFYLELGIPVNGRFVFDFDVYSGDSMSAPDAYALGTTAAVINTWYHLVGVYDAVNRTVSLFVNGALEAQVAAPGSFSNAGGLSFAYSRWQGQRYGGSSAGLDDVRAYPVALTASEVAALYASYPVGSVSAALTSPASGATFTAPASITLAASASTTSGSITKVEFYNGATVLGQSSTAPYTWQWNNVPAGSYSLAAKAYANTGLSASSASVNVTVQPGSVSSPPPAGQWNLDAAQSGITPDASPAGNTAALSGGYGFVAGKIGNAIQFDGVTGGALTLNAPFDSTRSFSVAAWVNPAQVSATQGFICQPAALGSTFYLELGEFLNGKLVFDFDVFPADSPTAQDAIAVGKTVPAAGTWYHIVGVYDAVNRQALLYVNGSIESRVSASPAFANAGGLALGYSKWKGGRVEGSTARLDDVRAYQIALTAAQVQALYQGR